MGSQQSARRVTVDNDTPTITISENVVKRLLSEDQARQKDARSSSSSAGGSERQTASRDGLASSGFVARSSPAGEQQEKRLVFETADSLLLRQQHEGEVKKLESFWKGQISELDQLNKQLHTAASGKLSADLNAVEERFNLNVKGRRCDPVCPDLERKLISCLETNKKTPLNCASLVTEYGECVDRARSQIFLGTKG